MYNIKSGPGYFFDLCHINDTSIISSQEEACLIDYKKICCEDKESSERSVMVYFNAYDCYYIFLYIIWEYDYCIEDKLIKN